MISSYCDESRNNLNNWAVFMTNKTTYTAGGITSAVFIYTSHGLHSISNSKRKVADLVCKVLYEHTILHEK